MTSGAAVRGTLPDCLVKVVGVRWFGFGALEQTYKDPSGRPSNVLQYGHEESRLEGVGQGRPWSGANYDLAELLARSERVT